jgi:alpha-L-rhamnosidase
MRLINMNRRTFLRNSALAGGAITLRNSVFARQIPEDSTPPASGSDQESGSSALVRRQFQSPAKKFRPIVRWWWPGDDVDEVELRREIEALDRNGLGGAEIQSFFKGLDSKWFSAEQMQQIDGFAAPSFFKHVAAAADEAHKRGLFIDYTFGSGWPFGGGEAITPELASLELRSTHLSVRGPANLRQRLQIPAVTDGDPLHGDQILHGLPDGWAERMKARARIVAVVAVRGDDAQWYFHATEEPRQLLRRSGRLVAGTSVDLTSQLDPDGTLHWDVPPGTWQVFVFSCVPTAQRINGAVGGPELVMDHLSAEAFRAHAKRVGDNAIPFVGEYFGNGLRAIFCDSLEVAANLFWCDDFLVEFRKRRGYDLTPYLPILKVQTYSEPFGEFVDLPIFEMAEIGHQVRHDYRLTVSDLMAERFYGEFNRWAHEHKLLSRTQAHGSPTDVLKVYGEADIPETEQLYDRGGYDFLKMAASSAHVYGRAIVGSESFVWPSLAYQTTPEKMKLAADELLTAGVNAIVYHGFPYRVPEVPPPGWHPFIGLYGDGNYSSQLNELNPFWPYLGQLNAYITRLQFLSQMGRNVAAVALYRNDLEHGAGEQPPAPRLNQALMDAGYNYDHINADSLLHFSVRGDKMLENAHGARYRALVLPALKSMDATLAERLKEFAEAGLPIVFGGEVPSSADGMLDRERNTQRVQIAIRDLRGRPNVQFSTDSTSAIAMLRAAIDPDVKFHSGALPFIHKQIGTINAFFVRNPTDVPQALHAEFEVDSAPELWDAWSGEAIVIENYRRNGKWIEVNHELRPLSSALIVFDANASSRPLKTVSPVLALKRTEPIGASGWALVATGLGPSGKTTTVQRQMPILIDWSLDSELRGISGRGVYTTKLIGPIAEAGTHLILDLGDVRDVAEVVVNGRPAGTLLLRPYQIDITDLVHPGDNTLEVTVTNSLYNCMVMRDPRAFRLGPAENPSGLMSAGLIGPVQVLVMS